MPVSDLGPPVSKSRNEKEKRETARSIHTTADHFALNPPLTNDGEEKGQGIDDGDGQAQFC